MRKLLEEPEVIRHLEKYLELAQSRFESGDAALAAFFAITAIEESGKLLMLRDANLKDKAERKRLLEHSEKCLIAAINLIDANQRLDALPSAWRNEVWDWIAEPKKLVRLRHECLYFHFHRSGNLMVPEQAVEANRAALVVYLAGMAIAELQEYISGLTPDWATGIRRSSETFRQQHLLM
jgi:AbiV family abortive infection protein